jgi:hypothetical protein
MDMKIDEYTGLPYDADKWYRGTNGCWVDKDEERKFLEVRAKREAERRDKRNASRVAKGKRRKPPSSFARSASRYAQYLREDCGESFGEWLKDLKFRERR